MRRSLGPIVSVFNTSKYERSSGDHLETAHIIAALSMFWRRKRRKPEIENAYEKGTALREAYLKPIKAGRLTDSEVRRFWQVGTACQSCELCRRLCANSEEGISVLAAYNATDENPIYVAPAHEGCNCTERYVTNLSRVTANPFDPT